MSLEHIWQQYRANGYDSVADLSPSDALDCFYLALLVFGRQAFEAALGHARQALERAPDDLVFAQAATYLQRVVTSGKQHVYVSGDGFAAFIRGGSNVTLYQATSAALRHVYQQYQALDVLDIGVGDGLALLPALTDNIRQLDILEPSGAMLTKVSAALDDRGVPHRAIESTLQSFVQQPAGSWDVIQATYSLQSIHPEQRLALLQWLREHGRRLLIAEFDDPPFSAQAAPDHVRYVVARYQQGLAEYDEDRDVVAQGFLMPVMFGYFDPTTARTNYEQSLQEWQTQLRMAGFQVLECRLLYPYWWAPAYFIDAQAGIASQQSL